MNTFSTFSARMGADPVPEMCVFFFDCYYYRSQCKSVSIGTRLSDGRLGFKSQKEQGFILFATVSRLALGSTKPPIQ
jgi:hypothetical protein